MESKYEEHLTLIKVKQVQHNNITSNKVNTYLQLVYSMTQFLSYKMSESWYNQLYPDVLLFIQILLFNLTQMCVLLLFQFLRFRFTKTSVL
jgi:hypothetical protein